MKRLLRASHDEIVTAHPAVPFIRLADDRAVPAEGDVARVEDSPPPA